MSQEQQIPTIFHVILKQVAHEMDCIKLAAVELFLKTGKKDSPEFLALIEKHKERETALQQVIKAIEDFNIAINGLEKAGNDLLALVVDKSTLAEEMEAYERQGFTIDSTKLPVDSKTWLN